MVSQDEKPAFEKGQLHLLRYLLGLATKTEGADLWRALFAEMLRNIEAGRECTTT